MTWTEWIEALEQLDADPPQAWNGASWIQRRANLLARLPVGPPAGADASRLSNALRNGQKTLESFMSERNHLRSEAEHIYRALCLTKAAR